MSQHENPFAKLAGEVRAGNTHVKAQMRQALEPCLVRIITRALASGAAPSPLQARIQALSRSLQEAGGTAPDRQRLAHVLSQRVVSRLAPTPTELASSFHTIAR